MGEGHHAHLAYRSGCSVDIEDRPRTLHLGDQTRDSFLGCNQISILSNDPYRLLNDQSVYCLTTFLQLNDMHLNALEVVLD